MAGMIVTAVTTEFRVCAAHLRTACAERGLSLPQCAAEALLAERIRADAQGTTEGAGTPKRLPLRDYLTDDRIDALVDDLASGAIELHNAVDAASPVLVGVPEAARIAAALGQLACCAVANSANDPWHANVLGETAGAAVTLWAFAIENAGPDQVTLVSADTVVRTRYALRAFLDRVADGGWSILGAAGAERRTLLDAIERDLARLD
jgi:biotin carboxylase